eukprot:9441813-Ditylum_brightwellii.AAC.1
MNQSAWATLSPKGQNCAASPRLGNKSTSNREERHCHSSNPSGTKNSLCLEPVYRTHQCYHDSAHARTRRQAVLAQKLSKEPFLH